VSSFTDTATYPALSLAIGVSAATLQNSYQPSGDNLFSLIAITEKHGEKTASAREAREHSPIQTDMLSIRSVRPLH
jgi:hypothetical protein